ncbi:hypothetical protein K2X85_12355 [bacterium]|nr:hypothetical protein [bacterium]
MLNLSDSSQDNEQRTFAMGRFRRTIPHRPAGVLFVAQDSDRVIDVQKESPHAPRSVG